MNNPAYLLGAFLVSVVLIVIGIELIKRRDRKVPPGLHIGFRKTNRQRNQKIENLIWVILHEAPAPLSSKPGGRRYASMRVYVDQQACPPLYVKVRKKQNEIDHERLYVLRNQPVIEKSNVDGLPEYHYVRNTDPMLIADVLSAKHRVLVVSLDTDCDRGRAP